MRVSRCKWWAFSLENGESRLTDGLKVLSAKHHGQDAKCVVGAGQEHAWESDNSWAGRQCGRRSKGIREEARIAGQDRDRDERGSCSRCQVDKASGPKPPARNDRRRTPRLQPVRRPPCSSPATVEPRRARRTMSLMLLVSFDNAAIPRCRWARNWGSMSSSGSWSWSSR